MQLSLGCFLWWSPVQGSQWGKQSKLLARLYVHPEGLYSWHLGMCLLIPQWRRENSLWSEGNHSCQWAMLLHQVVLVHGNLSSRRSSHFQTGTRLNWCCAWSLWLSDIVCSGEKSKQKTSERVNMVNKKVHILIKSR